MFRRHLLIIFSISTFILIGCKKQQNIDKNYLKQYFGVYHFTTIVENWSGAYPTTYDTLYQTGSVSEFKTVDSDSDLCASIEPVKETGQRCTIKFGYNSITPTVNSSDTFVVRYGPHYCHKGFFYGDSKVIFSVTGLGGLGGGYNYYVSGVKQ